MLCFTAAHEGALEEEEANVMEHFIVQIGILMAVVAALAAVLRLAKQSSILAYIIAGVGASALGLHVEEHVIHSVSETGIILLLFMAGLEVEISSLLRRWKLLLIVGLGQVLLNSGLGMLVGWLTLDITQVTTLVYFGLCLTFSSTIIVLGYLKSRNELGSVHGQIILGLMVIQDITAVMALAVLKALGTGAALGPAMGVLLVKMVGLALALGVVSHFLLRPLFRYMARSAELLFVGVLGWALGVAAFGEVIHFSPEIAAFLAGVAMSTLPYKLEIEDKVEPLKNFGVVLFFISLGLSLELGTHMFSYAVPVVVVALVAVLGTLPLALLLGWLGHLGSRPSFMIGGIINQISEFSLILATLCRGSGIFDDTQFMVITLACVVSIVISTAGHQFLSQIYAVLRRSIAFLDRHAIEQLLQDEARVRPFVVLLGHNALSQTIATHMRERKHHVVLVDLDPDVHASLVPVGDVHPLYADVNDPDTWEAAGFREAELVISCLTGLQSAELGALRWLREHKIEVPFVATTDSSAEALELYEAGAAYVIHTDALAAQSMRNMFSHGEFVDILTHGRVHHEDLRTLKQSRPEAFPFL